MTADMTVVEKGSHAKRQAIWGSCSGLPPLDKLWEDDVESAFEETTVFIAFGILTSEALIPVRRNGPTKKIDHH